MLNTIHFDTTDGIRRNLSELTGVNVATIDDFVESVEDWEYANRDFRIIWEEFLHATGCKPNILNAVLFHGCRCLPGTDFREGLLPNNLAVDLIWKQMFVAVGEQLEFEGWREWKTDFEMRCPGTYLDRIRSSRVRERGPWGKFVREEWFLEWGGSNHYTREAPEVVKAVLNTLSEPEKMLELYLRNTQGCLVHFRIPCDNPRRLGHGLIYLCDKRHCAVPQQYLGRYGWESMEGRAVPTQCILKVEFLSEAEVNPVL